ncbi:hypothetical protein BN85407780 [Alteracholeplasma palmae J233]|uniref:Uncharacterized protein n=1 Tax=Alteracholeplasma palmae (strain ATCC 49389 / J233) TaxID=1318466 RepID=U4KPX7_ALTPJ|nr:hypothetical protein [Alteracholeplasma palmae]CCV64355.1 hypothetical protein BN85407780 [Alteracholeplasma palmae J233]
MAFTSLNDIDGNNYLIHIDKITHVEISVLKKKHYNVTINFYDTFCIIELNEDQLEQLKNDLSI